jgi:hypothetical protein
MLNRGSKSGSRFELPMSSSIFARLVLSVKRPQMTHLPLRVALELVPRLGFDPTSHADGVIAVAGPGFHAASGRGLLGSP